MKKLNYAMAKSLLTRSELRRIIGGSGMSKECGDFCEKKSECNNPGCSSCKSGTHPTDPTKTANVCQ